MITTDYIENIRQKVANNQAKKGKYSTDYIQSIRNKVEQQAQQPVTTTPVQQVTQPVVSHAQMAQQGHNQLEQKQQAITTQVTKPMTNYLKNGGVISDSASIAQLAREQNVPENEIQYQLGRIEAAKTPTTTKTPKMMPSVFANSESVNKMQMENAKNQNPVTLYDKNYGKNEAEQEIKTLDFTNSKNGDKYLEYKEGLKEAEEKDDTRNKAKYEKLLNDYKDLYKANSDGTKDTTNIPAVRKSLESLVKDIQDLEIDYANAKTDAEKLNIAQQYMRIKELYDNKYKLYADAMAYDEIMNNNIWEDTAKSWDKGVRGGMAKTINGGWTVINRITGLNAADIDATGLLKWNNGERDDIYAASDAGDTDVTGATTSANEAYRRLVRIHNAFPDSIKLNNLYNQISKGTYKGTAQDLMNDLDEVAKDVYQTFKDAHTQDELDAQAEQLRHNEIYGGMKWLPNATNTVGEMAPSFAMGYVAGGLGEIGSAIANGGNITKGLSIIPSVGSMGTAGTVANTLQQIGSFSTLGLSAGAAGMDQALADGAKYNQAFNYGVLSGATEVGTEMLGGETVNAWFGKHGKTALGKVFGEAVNKLNIESKVGRFIANQVSGVASEVTEEMISEALEPLWETITYNPDALPDNLDELGQYFKNILNAGVEAIPSTLIMQGGGMITNAVNVQHVENGMIKSIQENKELSQIVKNQLINEVRKAANEVKAGISESESNTIEGQIEETMAMNAIDNNMSKAEQALKNNNYDMSAAANEIRNNTIQAKFERAGIKNTPQSAIDTLQFIQDTRGVDIQVNPSIKGNGTYQARPDGTRVITINPNSNRYLEFTLTHELGHDFENTPEYAELQKLVTDYAAGKDKYESAKASLKETYDREVGKGRYNLENEVTNDLLANALGDQEFYDRLALNPTLSDKVRNWFDNVLRDKGNTKLTLAERQFKNKLEKHFRDAYNSNFVNKKTGTRNSISERETLPKTVSEIKNLNQFLRDKMDSETDKTWKNRLRDALFSDMDILGKYETPRQRKKRTIQQYLDYKNQENNTQNSLSEDTIAPTKDSQGRQLSEGQQEYFKDSKARDENGNLQVLYHGTPAGGFTTFKEGTYLTPYKEYAADYTRASERGDNPQIYEVYANIKNPFTLKDKKARDIYINEYIKGAYALGIDPYESQEYYNSIDGIDWNEGDDLFNFLKEKHPEYDSIILNERYNDKGNEQSILVFNPNQIKNIDNAKPTSNPDIRYSLSEGDKTLAATHNLTEKKLKGMLELGGFPVPSIAISDVNKLTPTQFGDITVVFNKDTINPSDKRNEVYDRDVWSPTFPTIGYDISNDKIIDMLDENGIKIDYKDAMMASAANRFFDADNLKDYISNYDLDTVIKDMKQEERLQYVYAKTHLGLEPIMKEKNFSYEVTNKTLQKFLDLVGEENLDINDSEVISKNRDKIIELMVDDALQEKDAKGKPIPAEYAVAYKKMLEDGYRNNPSKLVSFVYDAGRLRYAKRNNELKTVDEDATKEKVENLMSYPEKKAAYEKWIDDTFGKMFENTRKGIRNDKDWYTPSGNRRKFNALYDDYTLGNLVKALTKQNTKGGQKTLVEGGWGKTTAQLSKKFKSIEDIRSSKGQLMNTDEMQQAVEPLKDKFGEDAYKLADYTHDSEGFYTFDNVHGAIEEFAQKYSSHLTIDNFKKILNDYQAFNTEQIPHELLQDIIDDLEQMKNIPTDYFEAKPQRAVGLDEIATVLIPNDTSEELKQMLRDRNINYVEYNPEVEGDREAKYKEAVRGSLFSKNNKQWQDFMDNNLNFARGTKTKLNNMLPTNEELQEQETKSKQAETKSVENEAIVKLEQGEDDTLFSLSEKEKQEVNDYIDKLFEDILLDENFRNRIAQRLNKVENYNQFKQIKNEVNDYKRNNSKGLTVDKNEAKEIIERNLGKYPGNSKTINKLVETINEGLADGTLTDAKINDLVNSLEDTYKAEDTSMYDDYKKLKKSIREARIYVPAEVKNGITDYNDFRKSNMGVLNLTSKRDGSMGIDQVYKELQNMYPEMLSEDIVNPIDQLERLSEVARDISIKKSTIGKYVAKNYGNEAWDEISNELRQDLIALKDKSIYRELSSVKANMDEALELSDDQEEKIAELLKERPEQQKMTTKEKLENIYKYTVNKGYFVDKLAEVSGNKQLMYKYDKMLGSANEGNYVVGEKQTNNKGKIIGKSVNEIWKPAEDAGKVQEFSDYLLHKLNIDRMSLENEDNLVAAETAFSDFIKEHPEFTQMSTNKIKKLALEDSKEGKLAQRYLDLDHQIEVVENRKNKPVFGETVTAEDSRKVVADYEKSNPEFKEWANDIKTFNRNQLQNMVDAGLTTAETQELLNTMYDNYIRIQRQVGGDSPIVNQRGRLKVNSPIKKAKGGNQDILPLKDSMAQQALEVKKAIARNSFGLELLNTLQNGETIQDYGEVLKEGKNGEAPTFTVFKDGQPVTMKINKELYDAIKPSERQSFEDFLIFKGVQKAVRLQKTLLTSKNPIFAFVNFIRDLQTAIVNSKDTGRMLLNYAKLAQYKFAESFNNATKKLTNKELNSKYDRVAELWELYKANGGESNTYFDFEKGTNLEPKNPVKRLADKTVDKIFAVNEVIEQLPRVAEFITTLENGGTIEEAMYNAADVTVNFKRGGEVTKFLDRNGASFLNASVQGLDKQIRNFTKGGVKGFANAVVKTALLGIAPQLLNHLLLGDDDDYEDLPNYVKDNYWLFKIGDKKFLRIPRGRDIPTFVGVIAQRTERAMRGDKHAFDGLVDTFSNTLAPNNPLDSNILSPLTAMGTNKSWSGNDIVSSSLQNKLPYQQYDAKDTEFAKWIAGTDLGKKLNLSPKKLDYLIDQYSGGIGDILIPMNTKYAEEGNALSSKFTTDTISNNKNINIFYDRKNELTVKNNSDEATDQETYELKFLNDAYKEIKELNKKQREIEMSDLPDKEKIKQRKETQKQINEIAKNANKTSEKYSEAADDYSDDIYESIFNSKLYNEAYDKDKFEEKIRSKVSADADTKAKQELGLGTDYKFEDTIEQLEENNIPLADYYLAYYAMNNLAQSKTYAGKQKAIKDHVDNLSKEQLDTLYGIFDIQYKRESK